MGRRSVRVIAAVLALVVLTAGASAQASSRIEQGLVEAEQQRERAERELGERQAEERDVRSRLERAEAEHAQAAAALDEVERALAAATEARDRATRRAEELRTRLREVEAELASTEAQLDEVRGRFDARVAGAFKRGGTRPETAVVSHLLTQETIADALATAPFLTAVIDADRRVVDEVHEARDAVVVQRSAAASLRVQAEREAQRAERSAREVATQVAAQEVATSALAQRRAELDAAHDAIVTDRRAIESHLASIEAESSRLEQELRALAAQRAREARERELREREAAERRAREDAARRDVGGPPGDVDDDAVAPPPSGEGWRWPAACGRVTSRYGGRDVAGGSRYHRGVDIACTRVLGPNPPITASRGGVVSPVGCGGGYGVCLIVDHLDGWFTLYAHMSSVAVTPGTSVAGGQVLGYEGSTGNSTGPHLHFEIWDGGTKVDPCPYIGC